MIKIIREEWTFVMKFNIFFRIVLCSFLVGVICLSGCGSIEAKSIFIVRYDDMMYSVQALGKVEASHKKNIICDIPIKFESIDKQLGEMINKDEIIATIDTQYVRNQIDDMQSVINTNLGVFNSYPNKKSLTDVKAPIKGRVKDIRISVSDEAEEVSMDNEYFMLISTKQEMCFSVESDDYNVNQKETIIIDGAEISGRVSEVLDGKAKITIDSDEYDIGTKATVRNELGDKLEGELQLSEYIPVYCPYGTITAIAVSENREVNLLDSLFTVNKYDDAVYATLAEIQEYQNFVNSYYEFYNNPSVLSPYAGVLTAIPSTDEPYEKGKVMYTVAMTEEMTVNLLVDEFDIYKVQIGQKVILNIDSTSTQRTEGTVVHISNHSNEEEQKDESWAKFTVVVQISDDDSLLIGSKVYGRIVVEEIKDVLIVPLSAVYTNADGTQYVLLDIEKGNNSHGRASAEYPEHAVVIKTGMQDGQYIEVLYGLSDGDRVILE